jgi:putative PIG3 family NAD(P)H quinone oxidoreductase
MRAILFEKPGSPDQLFIGSAPAPKASPDELLILVRATALNRADLLQRRGLYPPPPGASPILGLEVAGEVIDDSGTWQRGDRVMAVVTGGGYAERCVVPAGMAMPVPQHLTWEQAAAVPEAFLTAFLNLFVLGRLQPGERALIHAGASGVGSAAIQLAKAHGAHVFTTVGTSEKADFCEALGAGRAIVYRQQNWREQIERLTGGEGVHLILDCIGAAYFNDNLASLTEYGRLMLIGTLGGSVASLDLAPILPKSLTIAGTTLRRTPLERKTALVRQFIEHALPLFETGALRPVIDRVFDLAQAADAHRYMETNANMGKIILRVS